MGSQSSSKRGTGNPPRNAVTALKRRNKRLRIAGIVSAMVLVALAVLVIVKFSDDSSKSSEGIPAGPISPDVQSKLESVTAAQLAEASRTEPVPGPQKIDAPPLVRDGKPYVLYVGAEFCPFCAAERWAVTLAMSQFGTFEGLGVTHSGSDDVFPDTATVSFHGATYSSDLLAFNGVETRTNNRGADGQYTPLDTLAGEDLTIFSTYNSPPYVAGQGGSIPWIDLGGAAIHSGASFTPELMKDMTVDEIAAAVSDPKSVLGQQIRSAAGNYVRVLCGLTGGAPATACAPFTAS